LSWGGGGRKSQGEMEEVVKLVVAEKEMRKRRSI